jgi:hypothetical protein
MNASESLTPDATSHLPALELRVVQGLHEGAALRLLPPVITVGSDETCDVILLDPGVRPRHLQLVFDDVNGWLVESTGTALPLDSPIAVGEAMIIVTSPRQAWHAPESRPDREEDAGQSSPVMDTSHEIESATTGTHAARIPRAMSNRTRTSLVLMLLLLMSLLGLWLLSGWRLGVGRQQSIPVQTSVASLTLREFSPVRKVQALGEQPTPTQLDIQPPFALQGVVMGPVSYVVLSDGRRLYEGQSHAGWRLESIRSAEIVWMGSHRIEMPW